MAYEIRWLREDEWDQCLDLLGEVMNANRGYFSDSFRRTGARTPSLVLVDEGEIVSHIRIFDRRCMHPPPSAGPWLHDRAAQRRRAVALSPGL